MHELQKVFATEAGERQWSQDMHALFGAGALDEAEVVLAEALTAIDSELAWTCLELPREAVVLAGWDEMAEAIAMHEGESVTGVTIAIANESDRAFEKGQVHHPYVLLGIYTDEAFAFSKSSTQDLLDRCHGDMPEWAGKEEDIEVHMDIDGLDLINTRLAHHKQRHFFRDAIDGAAPASAPLPYVEYVVACWWRALRWHQAVATECAIRRLPRAIPVIAGMVDMRPEATAVYDAGDEDAQGGSAIIRPAAARLAESFGESFIQRKQLEEEKAPPNVLEFRRRAQAAGQADGEVLDRPRAGFLARLFGRR